MRESGPRDLEAFHPILTAAAPSPTPAEDPSCNNPIPTPSIGRRRNQDHSTPCGTKLNLPAATDCIKMSCTEAQIGPVLHVCGTPAWPTLPAKSATPVTAHTRHLIASPSAHRCPPPFARYRHATVLPLALPAPNHPCILIHSCWGRLPAQPAPCRPVTSIGKVSFQ